MVGFPIKLLATLRLSTPIKISRIKNCALWHSYIPFRINGVSMEGLGRLTGVGGKTEVPKPSRTSRRQTYPSACRILRDCEKSFTHKHYNSQPIPFIYHSNTQVPKPNTLDAGIESATSNSLLWKIQTRSKPLARIRKRSQELTARPHVPMKEEWPKIAF